MAPVDFDAECAVLGSVFADAHAYDDVGHLDDAAFADDRNRLIWRRLRDCPNRGDLVVVRDHLGKDLERVGGAAYLVRLAESPGAADRATEYAEIVERCYRKRVLGSTLERAVTAVAGDGDPTDELTTVRVAVDGWSSGRTGKRAATTCLADVVPESIEWLWPNRIPRGKLTLLVGDGGLGKSFCTLDWASRVSRGVAWPDGAAGGEPGHVVLMSAEDGLADTIRVRLDAAQADTSRITALTGIVGEDGREAWASLQDHLEHVERVIADVGATLLVVDPLTSYLGKVDSHKNAELRSVLGPLSALAERRRVAIVGVTHFNKSQGSSAAYRTIGSIAFTAAARMVWCVGKDPEDEKRRLMLPVKNNIIEEPTGLAFRLADGAVRWSAGEVQTTADQMLAAGQRDVDNTSALDKAMSFIRGELAGGGVPSEDVKASAREYGISDKTLQRARESLGIKPKKEGFKEGSRWVWQMPQSHEDGQISRSYPSNTDGHLRESWPSSVDETTQLNGDGHSLDAWTA